uniref:OsmC/Ohr family protein n=1 Tax=uncultured Nocardioidaceae bacterium TaxID=253824 RepID=A0A6J4KVH3_9ACTN|nr:MAG: OsmC/Ohr family protein [uncultured Nocardioidaceae bacterium]
MTSEHSYATCVRWTGNRGTGTSSYRDYGREHEVSAGERPVLLGSSDPAFRGDASRWSPEDLLVVALSQCHMLAYLHLCAVNGVVVQSYTDEATGTMRTHDGTGEFTEVTLHPRVVVAEASMSERAQRLHDDAHAACFIARSVSFPVRHDPHIAHP